ncbi:MAG: hypothetical protein KC910_17450 [Candidatus Eremiobacteraeota bacterium]|nr:hypothetical protein [Candidatus Eremiobacteraeota bacterium]
MHKAALLLLLMTLPVLADNQPQFHYKLDAKTFTSLTHKVQLPVPEGWTGTLDETSRTHPLTLVRAEGRAAAGLHFAPPIEPETFDPDKLAAHFGKSFKGFRVLGMFDPVLAGFPFHEIDGVDAAGDRYTILWGGATDSVITLVMRADPKVHQQARSELLQAVRGLVYLKLTD